MPFGHLPVASCDRDMRGRPVRLRDHPAVLGFDRQRDRALRRDHGVVPRALEIVDAGEPGERHRGDHEQTLVEARTRRGLERRPRRDEIAVGDQQVGLQRQQHEAAARRRGARVVEPAIERGVRLRSPARVAEPVRERGRREQAGRGVVRGERDGPLGPFDRIAAAQAAGGQERAALGDRRRQALVGGERAVLPGALEQVLRRLEVAGEDRQVRPDAVAPRARRDVGLLRESPRGGAVARVHQRLDRLQREPLALARSADSAGWPRGSSPRRSTTRRAPSPRARAPRGPRSGRRR